MKFQPPQTTALLIALQFPLIHDVSDSVTFLRSCDLENKIFREKIGLWKVSLFDILRLYHWVPV